MAETSVKRKVVDTGVDFRLFNDGAGGANSQGVTLVDNLGQAIDELPVKANTSYLTELSSTLLQTSEELNTGWLDLKDVARIQIEAFGDIPGMTLRIESSFGPGGTPDDVTTTKVDDVTAFQFVAMPVRQRYMRVRWQNNMISDVEEPSLAIKAFYGATDNVAVSPLSSPLENSDLAALTRSVIIGKDADGDYINVAINKGGAILTADFLVEVARGAVPGYMVDGFNGRNADIDVGVDEDVWGGGGLYTGQPSDNLSETVEAFSSDAADAAAGTGARTIRITGLKTDASTIVETEDITLNGTTGVASVSAWYRIWRIEVLTAGTGGENAGTITIRHTGTTANVFAQVPPAANRSDIAALTIPATKTGFIVSFRGVMARSNGSAGSAELSLRIRKPGGVYVAERIWYITDTLPAEPELRFPIEVIAGSDIKVRCTNVSDANTQPAAEADIVLIDN